MTVVSAFADDALGELDAVGVAEALGRRDVSRAQIRAAAISRCLRVGHDLNAVAHQAFEQSEDDADERQPAEFFDGVPTFVKDMVQIAGLPTTQGTDAWEAAAARRDGAFLKRFRGLGVVILGSSRMSEFGFSPVAEHPRIGPVRNPWNTALTAGGSSAGSGALVASGAVPFAHAVDGGGSIRIPAACNGLVGLKPTRGRLPLDSDLRGMPIRIVSNGILTRTVRDTAAFYREMEKLWPAGTLPAVGDVRGPSRARLRIAVATHSVNGESTPEVADETMRVAAVLEALGHRIEVIDVAPVPASFSDDFLSYWALLAFALVRSGPVRFGRSFDRTRLDDVTLGLADRASRSLWKTPAVIARLSRTRRFSEEFYAKYDVLLTPTLLQPPLRIGELDPQTGDLDSWLARVLQWVAFTPFQNVTGEPSLSLPTGQSDAGSPIGTLFSSARGTEARLLHLGYELAETQRWRSITDSFA